MCNFDFFFFKAEVNRAQGIEVQEDGRVVKKSSKDAGEV